MKSCSFDCKKRLVINTETWSRWFLLSAAIIFLITGWAKILSSGGSAKILALTDPIFGISFTRLMLIVGIAEVLIALISIAFAFSDKVYFAIGLVAWMTLNFVLYRVALWIAGWDQPCPCFGNLTSAIHISQHLADSILKSILAYLSIGSVAALFSRYKLQSDLPLE